MTLVAEYEVTNLILKPIDKLCNYIKGEKDLEESLEKLKSILERQRVQRFWRFQFYLSC